MFFLHIFLSCEVGLIWGSPLLSIDGKQHGCASTRLIDEGHRLYFDLCFAGGMEDCAVLTSRLETLEMSASIS